MSFPVSFFEALCIALALSLDAFAAAFSYGTDRIRIPFLSILVIDGVGSLSILFLLGTAKLLDGITKSIIKKHGAISSNIQFSFCNFRFVLNLYANPQCADTDHSKTLSPKEAAMLALALSLDGCAVGFGTGLGHASCLLVFLCSLVVEGAAVLFGIFLGNRAAGKFSCSISWVGGLILLLLALAKLF